VRARDGDRANTANSHWRQRRAVAVSSGGSFELARLIERARVGNVKNNDRSLIEPVAGVG